MNAATSRRRWRIAPLLALTTALALAITFAGPAAALDEDISIDAEGFSHASVTILVGETVTWTNNDAGVTHSVTAEDGTFDSGDLAPGETFAHTFTEAGTYAYSSSGNGEFEGVVVVEVGGIGGNGDAEGLEAETPAPPATGTGTVTPASGMPWMALGGLALMAIAGSALLMARRES